MLPRVNQTTHGMAAPYGKSAAESLPGHPTGSQAAGGVGRGVGARRARPAATAGTVTTVTLCRLGAENALCLPGGRHSCACASRTTARPAAGTSSARHELALRLARPSEKILADFYQPDQWQRRRRPRRTPASFLKNPSPWRAWMRITRCAVGGLPYQI